MKRKKKRGGISEHVLRSLGWTRPKRTKFRSGIYTFVIIIVILFATRIALWAAQYSKLQPDMTLLAATLVVAGLIVAPSVRALRDRDVLLAEAPLLVVAGFVGLALIASVLVIGYNIPNHVAGF